MKFTLTQAWLSASWREADRERMDAVDVDHQYAPSSPLPWTRTTGVRVPPPTLWTQASRPGGPRCRPTSSSTR